MQLEKPTRLPIHIWWVKDGKHQRGTRIIFSLQTQRSPSIQEYIDAANTDRALNIDNQEIKKTEQIRLLGVYIDENLNFAGHISDQCTRTSQKVGLLVRLRNLIRCNAKLTLYKSVILPHLIYCPHLVWNFCKSSESRKIERVQERALRAIIRELKHRRFWATDVDQPEVYILAFRGVIRVEEEKFRLPVDVRG